MRIRRISLFLTIVVVFFRLAAGQGFVNLNFEQATIPPTPAGVYPADPGRCFPGWTVGGSNTTVAYNDVSTGGPMVSLMGPDFPNFVGYAPIQGSYSVLLQYFGFFGPPPSLSQTGLVPVGTESIDFLVGNGENAAVVTMNGVNIPLISISADEMAGDVLAFAGTIAQLTFSTTDSTAYTGQWLYFDDIQFSSSPIPEPSTFSLLSIVFIVLFLRMMRSNNMINSAASATD